MSDEVYMYETNRLPKKRYPKRHKQLDDVIERNLEQIQELDRKLEYKRKNGSVLKSIFLEW